MAEARRHGMAAILGALRRELKARGLRVGPLARELGVAEPTVWRWLRGEGLTLDRLDAICAIADLDLRDLLGSAGDERQEGFTLAQERVLAADRGLALVFFSILNGAQRDDIERALGLPPARLEAHLERLERLGLIDLPAHGRMRARTRRAVRWRRGGPLSIAFERTVKSLFLSMDFGAADARYVSDMVRMGETGRARVHALFEALREDAHLIAEQEEAARLEGRAWSGLLMMVRPLDMDAVTREWTERDKRPPAPPADGAGQP